MNAKLIPIKRNRIAASFGAAASEYDSYADLQREVADALLHKLPEQEVFNNILDLGSGTGYCTALLEQQYPGCAVYCLDLALPMLIEGRKKLSKNYHHAICADAESLPIQSGSINLIISSLTVQWCFRLENLFAELARVLDKNGRILLSTFAPGSLQELQQAWQAVDSYTHVNTFFPPKILTEYAEQAGLSCTYTLEEKVRYYGSLNEVAKELKGIGAHNMNAEQGKGLTGHGRIKRVQEKFGQGCVQGKGIPVTYKILYLSLSKKHQI